jgi:hypothetical protein
MIDAHTRVCIHTHLSHVVVVTYHLISEAINAFRVVFKNAIMKKKRPLINVVAVGGGGDGGKHGVFSGAPAAAAHLARVLALHT